MAKAPDAFRTISEVAELLDTPPHVLRFWESRFSQLKPVKRAGGRRYYRPTDLLLLGGIKRLLHDDGMTIRGVQKMLSDQGVPHVAGLADPALFAANEGAPPAPQDAAEDLPEPETDAAVTEGAKAAKDTPAPDEAEVQPEAAEPHTLQAVSDPAEENAPVAVDTENDTRPVSGADDAGEDEEPGTGDAAAVAPDQPEGPAPGADAPATDTPGAEADLFARILAADPARETAPETAPAPDEAETETGTDAAPDAPAPTLAEIASRLRRLSPEDVAKNRAALETLRARLIDLHTRRSERLVAARF